MPGGIWKTRHYRHGRRGAGTVKRVRNPCSVKLAGRAQVLRTSTLTQEHPARGEEHNDVIQGEVGGSLPSDQQTDDTEARFGLWSISGNHIYRHHVQPRVKLYVPKEGSFPIPLKYFDVVRRTNTTLDVLLESRIDDDWNVDGCRELSGPWTRFTQFTTSIGNLPNGYMWSGGGAIDRSSSNLQARLPMARGLVKDVKKNLSTKRKTALDYRNAEARQCSKVERHLLHRSVRHGVQ